MRETPNSTSAPTPHAPAPPAVPSEPSALMARETWWQMGIVVAVVAVGAGLWVVAAFVAAQITSMWAIQRVTAPIFPKFSIGARLYEPLAIAAFAIGMAGVTAFLAWGAITLAANALGAMRHHHHHHTGKAAWSWGERWATVRQAGRRGIEALPMGWLMVALTAILTALVIHLTVGALTDIGNVQPMGSALVERGPLLLVAGVALGLVGVLLCRLPAMVFLLAEQPRIGPWRLVRESGRIVPWRQASDWLALSVTVAILAALIAIWPVIMVTWSSWSSWSKPMPPSPSVEGYYGLAGIAVFSVITVIVGHLFVAVYLANRRRTTLVLPLARAVFATRDDSTPIPNAAADSVEVWHDDTEAASILHRRRWLVRTLIAGIFLAPIVTIVAGLSLIFAVLDVTLDAELAEIVSARHKPPTDPTAFADIPQLAQFVIPDDYDIAISSGLLEPAIRTAQKWQTANPTAIAVWQRIVSRSLRPPSHRDFPSTLIKARLMAALGDPPAFRTAWAESTQFVAIIAANPEWVADAAVYHTSFILRRYVLPMLRALAVHLQVCRASLTLDHLAALDRALAELAEAILPAEIACLRGAAASVIAAPSNTFEEDHPWSIWNPIYFRWVGRAKVEQCFTNFYLQSAEKLEAEAELSPAEWMAKNRAEPQRMIPDPQGWNIFRLETLVMGAPPEFELMWRIAEWRELPTAVNLLRVVLRIEAVRCQWGRLPNSLAELALLYVPWDRPPVRVTDEWDTMGRPYPYTVAPGRGFPVASRRWIGSEAAWLLAASPDLSYMEWDHSITAHKVFSPLRWRVSRTPLSPLFAWRHFLAALAASRNPASSAEFPLVLRDRLAAATTFAHAMDAVFVLGRWYSVWAAASDDFDAESHLKWGGYQVGTVGSGFSSDLIVTVLE